MDGRPSSSVGSSGGPEEDVYSLSGLFRGFQCFARGPRCPARGGRGVPRRPRRRRTSLDLLLSGRTYPHRTPAGAGSGTATPALPHPPVGLHSAHRRARTGEAEDGPGRGPQPLRVRACPQALRPRDGAFRDGRKARLRRPGPGRRRGAGGARPAAPGRAGAAAAAGARVRAGRAWTAGAAAGGRGALGEWRARPDRLGARPVAPAPDARPPPGARCVSLPGPRRAAAAHPWPSWRPAGAGRARAPPSLKASAPPSPRLAPSRPTPPNGSTRSPAPLLPRTPLPCPRGSCEHPAGVGAGRGPVGPVQSLHWGSRAATLVAEGAWGRAGASSPAGDSWSGARPGGGGQVPRTGPGVLPPPSSAGDTTPPPVHRCGGGLGARARPTCRTPTPPSSLPAPLAEYPPDTANSRPPLTPTPRA